MKKSLILLNRLLLGEQGGTSVEYAILAGAIVSGLIASLGIWGNFLQTMWANAVASALR